MVLWSTWSRSAEDAETRGPPHPDSATIGMATASTSGQSGFGLGRKKKNPGLMEQIGQFFGGDKKKRSKVRVWVSTRVLGPEGVSGGQGGQGGAGGPGGPSLGGD